MLKNLLLTVAIVTVLGVVLANSVIKLVEYLNSELMNLADVIVDE